MMLRQSLRGAVLGALMLAAAWANSAAAADQHAYGTTWGGANSYRDWDRLYHYPYVYYPQNFYSQEYYKSSDSMYYRYPPEMRIPVYNKKWYNYYPTHRRYHYGSHFVTDVL